MRRSRTQRINAHNEAASVQSEEQKIDARLDKIAQDLKLIDLSRRIVLRSNRMLPFALIGAVFFGLLFLGTILSLSIFGLLIFGGIFIAIMAQIIGPNGALTRQKAEPKKVAERLVSLEEHLSGSIALPSLVIFGVKSISKSGITFSNEYVELNQETLSKFSESGRFEPVGLYKYIGLAVKQPDNKLVCLHKPLNRQDWLNIARAKGVKDEQSEEALQAMRA